MTTNRPHPHFDDRGAHDWNRTWQEASALALRDGKRVLIDIGREL